MGSFYFIYFITSLLSVHIKRLSSAKESLFPFAITLYRFYTVKIQSVYFFLGLRFARGSVSVVYHTLCRGRGGGKKPMTGARQTITLVLTFIKSTKNSLGRQAKAYESSGKQTPCIRSLHFPINFFYLFYISNCHYTS